jgi:outer membrane protein OmpA-like peptidoglycan-associated protein
MRRHNFLALICVGLALPALAASAGNAGTAGQGSGSSAHVQTVNVKTVSDLLDRAREIRFDGTTAKISDSAARFLDDLAAALTREPKVRLEIVCHTADNGDAKKDLALSKRRAETVKYALVLKGAGTDQLVATGRGSEDPIEPNLTRTGRMRNDRTELHRAPAQKANP